MKWNEKVNKLKEKIGEIMYREERREKILQLLTQKTKISVHELQETFSVSGPTIRKDLTALEEKNKLKRTHGGAILIQENSICNIIKRRTYKKDIKVKIGEKTAELIKNKETIMIDAGTTTYEVAKRLHNHRDLTIISNSLEICNLLTDYESIQIVATGGVINKKNLSMRGSLGIEVLSQYAASKAIIGLEGFSLEYGLTVSNELAAMIKQQMILSSNEIFIVATSDKFNHVAFARFCHVHEIDKLITDENIPKEYLEALEKMGIEVILVKINEEESEVHNG